jgi:broad specificity phosphatase PhoE
MPGGESLRDVHDRVADVLAEVVAELRAGRGVAVVAHYWSLRMLVGGLAGMTFEEVLERGDYAPENASVWRVDLAADGVDAVRVARASWA